MVNDKVIFEFVAEHFSRDCVVFDVGANVGKWTLSAKNLLKQCEFYSYEPVLENFKKMKRDINKENLKNVNIYLKGMSERFSERAIIRGGGEGGTFHEGSQKFNTPLDQVNYVPLTTLDIEIDLALARTAGYSKIFVKIDVEGFELRVLKGAQKYLAQKRISVLMWERNPEVMDRLESNVPLVSEIKFLRDYGYRIYLLARDVAIELFEDEIFNIFCSQAMNICYPHGVNCPSLYKTDWRSAKGRCSPTVNLFAILDDDNNNQIIERIEEKFPSECKV